MAVSALRAPVSHTTARPDGRPARSDRRGAPPAARPLLPGPAMRLISTLALVAFGAGHWMAQVEPAAEWRALAATVLAAGTALALLAIRRIGSPLRRRLALAATILVAVVAAMVAGGLHVRYLWWENWGLARQLIGSGLDGLAGARVPYRGIDEGLQLVIPMGGTLLAVVIALLAFWPRSRGRLGFRWTALIVAVTLYAIPATIVVFDQEFLRGAVLTVLVLLFWRGERLLRPQARAALVVAGVAAVGALAVAPALDGDGPWFDYEGFVQDNAGGKTESFSWDHDYSALLWPRDGREMLRIKARSRTYWKVEMLEGFDGNQWEVNGNFAPGQGDLDGVAPINQQRWTQDLRVSVRSLESFQLPLAGTALTVGFPDREASQSHPGVWNVGRDLRRGDAYEARVYTPQPSREQLDDAGTAYGPALRGQTAFQVQIPPVGQAVRDERIVYVPGFKGTMRTFDDGLTAEDGAAVLSQTDLARTSRLSRRLLLGADTPYAYVQAIQRYLNGPGFEYDEAPPIAARTLDGFLFDAKAGFCQQYSGAMALLLRMGGVPSRVVTGFAPGAYNRKSKEFVVRDVDAHSWVEAFFPGIGWVTFDPTPSAAPPRAQGNDPAAPSAGNGDVRDLGTTLAPDFSSATTPEGEEELPWTLIVASSVALVGLLLIARWAWRRRGRAGRSSSPVLELEAALRGVGWTVPAGVTLGTLERQLAPHPDAVAYVQALRAARYAREPAGPTPTQRRRLRTALTRGRSPLARWRAWRALPPRLRG